MKDEDDSGDEAEATADERARLRGLLRAHEFAYWAPLARLPAWRAGSAPTPPRAHLGTAGPSAACG